MTDAALKQSTLNDYSHQHLQLLEEVFPDISHMQLTSTILASPLLQKLANLIKFSIPVHTYSAQLLQLYEQITDHYYEHVLRETAKQRVEVVSTDQSQLLETAHQHLDLAEINRETHEKKPLRARINYLELSNFIQNYTPDIDGHVHQQVIREGQRFGEWDIKQVFVNDKKLRDTPHKKDNRAEAAELKFRQQKGIQNQVVNIIMMGKNISLQAKLMKNQLIERAKSNKLLENTGLMSLIQKIGIQINFILNRLTQEYFLDFLMQLQPYASHDLYSYILVAKIIQKVQQQHNFISIYSRLVHSLRNVQIDLQGKTIQFKRIFSQQMQKSFYKLIRLREWNQRQQLYKKQLIGTSIFIGELIKIKVLSKLIFPDCFYQLINSYVRQYHQFKNNKNFYYYQIYIECILKIIDKMGKRYNSLLQSKPKQTINNIVSLLLDINKEEEYDFRQVCDFVEVIKLINQQLPSQRFKITFMLQDFRCSKVIKKDEADLDNQEYEVVKQLLAIDHAHLQDIAKIPQLVARCNPNLLMKDFYFQFADCNSKQVNKNIDTFKLIMNNQRITEAAVQALRDNLQGLFMIESDLPYLSQGIARILKLVCQSRFLQWRQLQLFHSDEDVNEFVESIEANFFKMIVQD